MKRVPIHHELKILEQYFQNYLEGDKNFEIRLNDRGYVEGDTVTMYVENRPDLGTIEGKITYVTKFMLMPGYVAFALKNIQISNAKYLQLNT